MPRETADTPQHSLSSSAGTWPWLTTRRPLRPSLITTRPLEETGKVRQGERGRGGRERHLQTNDKRERGERDRQAGRGEAGTKREGRTGATLTNY
jgi:hypothetical protein